MIDLLCKSFENQHISYHILVKNEVTHIGKTSEDLYSADSRCSARQDKQGAKQEVGGPNANKGQLSAQATECTCWLSASVKKCLPQQ